MLPKILLGFAWTLTLLLLSIIGGVLFGHYRIVSLRGTSMEPTLRNGDVLWVKLVPVDQVKINDIVGFESPFGESITHRLIKVESMSKGSFLLTTKGDSNFLPEETEASVGSSIEVLRIRIPAIGYILDFLGTLFGVTLSSLLTVALFVIWINRRRFAHITKQNSS